MAQYPIKMLKDENGTPFVPLVASPCHKFSIKGRYRYACQVVKDHKLDRGDGSTFDVTATEVKQEEMEVYEILTKSGTYTLANGIICECEAI